MFSAFLFCIAGLSLNAQELKSLDSYQNSQKENTYFIVFGYPSCSDCYRQIYNLLSTINSKSQVFAVGIASQNALIRRSKLNYISEKIGIDVGQIYFTENLDSWNDTVTKGYYPKLLIFYPDKPNKLYQYEDLYNGEQLNVELLK